MPLRAVGPWPAKPSTAGRSRCAGLNFSGEASLRRFARTGRRQQISVRLRVPDCIEDNTSYPRKVPSRQIQCLHATVSNVRQMAQVCRRIPAYSSTSQAREPAPRTKVCSSQKPFVSRTLGSMGTSPSIKSLRPLKRRQQVAAEPRRQKRHRVPVGPDSQRSLDIPQRRSRARPHSRAVRRA